MKYPIYHFIRVWHCREFRLDGEMGEFLGTNKLLRIHGKPLGQLASELYSAVPVTASIESWLSLYTNRTQENGGNRVSVIVPDITMRVEADTVRAAGGIMLKVIKPGFEPTPEINEIEFGYSIHNDQSLLELEGETLRQAKRIGWLR
jgi:hypothetical protein